MQWTWINNKYKNVIFINNNNKTDVYKRVELFLKQI